MAQGYNDRLDESLGMKHKGAHKQSLKGMAKKMTGHAYSGNHSMKEDKHYPASVKSHLSRAIRK